MTRKQTFFAVFIFAAIVSLFLLAVILKIDSHLEESKLAIVELEKQINKLQVENQDLKKLPVFEMKTQEDYPINETLLPLFKRKLLQAILELRKGKKR